VLISSRGTIEGVYRKTHETRDVMARKPYTLGNDLPVFQTPWGKTGILICHDRWYPENVRTLRLKGAELILNPTASAVCSPHHKYHDIHRCVLRAQAYQNGLFWVNCNSANHGGCSVVLGPDGSVVAEGHGEEQVILAHLQPSAHDQYDFLANMRPNLYARFSTKVCSRAKLARRRGRRTGF
jgi:predicted amidohydrolase